MSFLKAREQVSRCLFLFLYVLVCQVLLAASVNAYESGGVGHKDLFDAERPKSSSSTTPAK